VTTEEQLAQQEKEIAELKTKNAELTVDLEKKQGIVDNAEAKFNEMSKESGDNRKGIAEAGLAMLAAQKERNEAKVASDALDAELKKLKPADPPDDGKNRKTDEKTPDEIEENLTAAESKTLDEAWKNADDEMRAAIKKSPDTRKAFLLKAIEKAKSDADSDLSDWRKKPGQEPAAKDEDLDKKLENMFTKQKKRSTHMPPGPSGGSSREGGAPKTAPSGRDGPSDFMQ